MVWKTCCWGLSGGLRCTVFSSTTGLCLEISDVQDFLKLIPPIVHECIFCEENLFQLLIITNFLSVVLTPLFLGPLMRPITQKTQRKHCLTLCFLIN